MPWGEAVRLVKVLIDDPTSQIASAVSGWDRPWSHEWAATVDLFDAFRQAHFKSPKPYPRPWPDPNSRRRGRTDKSRAEVISILNAHGHKIAG
jgi:hypothetical protein